MKNFFIVIFFTFSLSSYYSQLVINEGCNKNYLSKIDEDGDSPDWVELFNGSSENIQLSNYFLTDNPSNPFAWQLPNVSLAPGEFQIGYVPQDDIVHRGSSSKYED